MAFTSLFKNQSPLTK